MDLLKLISGILPPIRIQLIEKIQSSQKLAENIIINIIFSKEEKDDALQTKISALAQGSNQQAIMVVEETMLERVEADRDKPDNIVNGISLIKHLELSSNWINPPNIIQLESNVSLIRLEGNIEIAMPQGNSSMRHSLSVWLDSETRRYNLKEESRYGDEKLIHCDLKTSEKPIKISGLKGSQWTIQGVNRSPLKLITAASWYISNASPESTSLLYVRWKHPKEVADKHYLIYSSTK